MSTKISCHLKINGEPPAGAQPGEGIWGICPLRKFQYIA